MKFLEVFTINVALLSSISCFPDCIFSNYTCPLTESLFLFPPKPLDSWEKCLELCNNETSCTSFTFYGNGGAPFENMCLLFKEHCKDREMVHCKSCLSGYECNHCSIKNISYHANGSNFIRLFESLNETECRNECMKLDNCEYYTIYFQDNDLMPNTCVLLSDSSKPIDCEGCRTGPKICKFSRQCKANEAVITRPGFPARNHAFSDKVDFETRVETMGCAVEANVLVVGGGGSGGRMYNSGFSSSSVYLYGGGGSGYIAHATITIPYSCEFAMFAGSGGSPSKINMTGEPSVLCYNEDRSTDGTGGSGKIILYAEVRTSKDG